MRDFRTWTLAAAALVAWCVPARAAEEKAKLVPEGGAVQILLLGHRSVRDHLNLGDSETKKIDEFSEQQWKKAQRADQLSPQEGDRAFAEMEKENERFLDQNLKPEQRKRLDEITLQFAGLLWVTRSDVAAKLNLTAEQKARAAQYQKEARAEMEELLHSNTPGDRHARLREIRATSRKRLMELLTDEQETKWKEMAGKPFKGELRFEPFQPGSRADK